jgi:hypothetical protein
LLYSAFYNIHKQVGILMDLRHCTCGAEASVRRSSYRNSDGRDEEVFRVVCPVCGQLGPAIPIEGKDEDAAIAEAIQAWNDMIAELRPMGD